MDVRHRDMPPKLQQGKRKERDVVHSRRLRIVILAMRGWTARAIAMSAGLPGLEDRARDGRPAPLTAEQEERPRQRLDAGPGLGDGRLAGPSRSFVVDYRNRPTIPQTAIRGHRLPWASR
jgi:hypothetical protein